MIRATLRRDDVVEIRPNCLCQVLQVNPQWPTIALNREPGAVPEEDVEYVQLNHPLRSCRGHQNPAPKPHPSQQITIVRTHISLLRLLKFRQAQIAWTPIPVSVLHPTGHEIGTTAYGAQAYEADAYAVPAFVLRRVLCLEGVGGDDAADVAETDLPRGADGPAMVPTQIEVEPADDDGHG